MWMIRHEKSEFWRREFSIMQKTIYGELEQCWQKGFNVNSQWAKDENLVFKPAPLPWQQHTLAKCENK